VGLFSNYYKGSTMETDYVRPKPTDHHRRHKPFWCFSFAVLSSLNHWLIHSKNSTMRLHKIWKLTKISPRGYRWPREVRKLCSHVLNGTFVQRIQVGEGTYLQNMFIKHLSLQNIQILQYCVQRTFCTTYSNGQKWNTNVFWPK
jgi:hypothetical protein